MKSAKRIAEHGNSLNSVELVLPRSSLIRFGNWLSLRVDWNLILELIFMANMTTERTPAGFDWIQNLVSPGRRVVRWRNKRFIFLTRFSHLRFGSINGNMYGNTSLGESSMDSDRKCFRMEVAAFRELHGGFQSFSVNTRNRSADPLNSVVEKSAKGSDETTVSSIAQSIFKILLPTTSIYKIRSVSGCWIFNNRLYTDNYVPSNNLYIIIWCLCSTCKKNWGKYLKLEGRGNHFPKPFLRPNRFLKNEFSRRLQLLELKHITFNLGSLNFQLLLIRKICNFLLCCVHW